MDGQVQGIIADTDTMAGKSTDILEGPFLTFVFAILFQLDFSFSILFSRGSNPLPATRLIVEPILINNNINHHEKA